MPPITESRSVRIHLREIDQREVQKALNISSFRKYAQHAELFLEIFFEDAVCKLVWLRPRSNDWTEVIDHSRYNLMSPKITEIYDMLTNFGGIPAIQFDYEVSGHRIVLPLTRCHSSKNDWETLDLDLGPFYVDVFHNAIIQGPSKLDCLLLLLSVSYFEIIFRVFPGSLTCLTVCVTPTIPVILDL